MVVAGARGVVAPVRRVNLGTLEQTGPKESKDSASQHEFRCSHFAPRSRSRSTLACLFSFLFCFLFFLFFAFFLLLLLSTPSFRQIYAESMSADSTPSRPGCRLDMSATWISDESNHAATPSPRANPPGVETQFTHPFLRTGIEQAPCRPTRRATLRDPVGHIASAQDHDSSQTDLRRYARHSSLGGTIQPTTTSSSSFSFVQPETSNYIHDAARHSSRS